MKKTNLLLLFALLFCQMAATAQTQRVFMGTMTSRTGTGVYSALIDNKTGMLTDLRKESGIISPSFLALSEDGKYLYAFGNGLRRSIRLYTFKIGKDNRTLTVVDSLETGVSEFCHITPINKGRTIGLAGYMEGKFAYIDVDKKGKFRGELSVIEHNTVATKEAGLVAHAHQVRQDPLSDRIYVNDLGLDKIKIYALTGSQYTLETEISIVKGAGPRHSDFHPNGRYLAVLNELNSTIMVLERDAKGAFTSIVQTTSLNPADYTGKTWSGDIHYTPDGRFLYASERANSTIVGFKVDASTGKLTQFERVEEKINVARNFNIDPTGKWLLVANQDGASVVVYAIDKTSGKLTLVDSQVELPVPSCIIF